MYSVFNLKADCLTDKTMSSHQYAGNADIVGTSYTCNMHLPEI